MDTLLHPPPSELLDNLLDGLVAQYGERHRPLLEDVLRCAYSLGRDSMAYEATQRFREALIRYEPREPAA